MADGGYRGRLAPSPTGYLHLGHAATFYKAWQRARQAGGRLILRDEDLDPSRSRPDFAQAMLEDLRWLGLDWEEGPDVGGAYGPYRQSERGEYYVAAWSRLLETGLIYPCTRSRREIREAASWPEHLGEAAEAIFPAAWRPEPGSWEAAEAPGECNWRFRVPDGEEIRFVDERLGAVCYRAGEDFGDFLVWRRDGAASYELAVVVDDLAMAVTEVVRGEDLLLSTARQLLLYRAFGGEVPAWYHASLVCDEAGKRLAKRDEARSLRSLREAGRSAAEVVQSVLECE